MHLRKLTLAVGLIGALCGSGAFGLGLGEITLNSTLNQPLDAQIKLLQVRDLTEEDILVELARAEDFQRFGVDRIFFLQNLRFEVELDGADGPVVKITTEEPVREPYLIFLLEAQSPGGGRLLREYTLLMDLPVFAESAAQPVQAPQSAPAPQPTQPATAARINPAAPVQRQGEPPRAQPAPGSTSTASFAPGSEVYGPVKPNDTLWEIAESLRPSDAVSVQQTMIALQRANPDAFINDNINLLKRGQVLRVPSESEIRELDPRTALSEVASQNASWTAARDSQMAGVELQASGNRPSAASSSQPVRGQLTIAAPGDSDNAGARSGAGDSSASTEALENELAITAEQLDATQRENAELSARVAELEEQIATMERLLEVSSEELRTLQLATEASQNQPAPAPAEEPAADAAPVDSAATAEAEESASEAAAENSPAPAAQPQPEKAVVVSQPAAQPSLVDTLMANLWYLLVGLLAIVGGLVYFLHRRSQNEAWESFDAEDELFDASNAMSDDMAEPFESADYAESMETDEEEMASFEEEAQESEAPVEAETGDAVGEADIYIAYGKFDQAEEMLQKAIVSEPNNVDARLKLLEVYAETRDVEKFDRQYRHIQALGDAAATAKAAEMRSSIPGAGDYPADTASGDSFTQGEAAQGEDNSLNDSLNDSLDDSFNDSLDDSFELSTDFAEQGFDLDLGGDSGSQPANEVASANAEDEGGFADLDLALEEPATTDATSSTDDVDSFDFDLELDDIVEGIPGSAEKEDSLDFGLDLDASDLSLDDDALELDAEALDTALPGESDDSEDGIPELDASLDLSGEADFESADTAKRESDKEFDFDFELELDKDLAGDLDLSLEDADGLESETPAGGSDFSLDLGLDEIEAEVEQPAGEQSASEGEIFADLEFNAESVDDEELPTLGNVETSSASADLSDDGFDLDMGDLDLEALDQEMDALVGEVGDLADDDIGIATPALASKPAAAAESEFDLDSLNLDAFDPEALKADGEADFAFGEDQEVDEHGAGDLESELDFLADADEVATKLDLARAYIDMGDQDGARDILDEVSTEGSDEQKREAAELLEKMV